MRSTSMTPLPDALTRPDAVMKDGDGDDIILVSENLRTPRNNPGSSSSTDPTPPTTPSPSAKRRLTPASYQKSTPQKRAKHREGDDVKQGRRGKRNVDEVDDDEDDEYKDERAISAELQAEKREKDDKKAVGGGEVSPRKVKRFTLAEDNLIIEQIINNFDANPVKDATNRTWSTVMYRFRTILKAAMRNLHGEEHAVLPGETAGSTTKR